MPYRCMYVCMYIVYSLHTSNASVHIAEFVGFTHELIKENVIVSLLGFTAWRELVTPRTKTMF